MLIGAGEPSETETAPAHLELTVPQGRWGAQGGTRHSAREHWPVSLHEA